MIYNKFYKLFFTRSYDIMKGGTYLNNNFYGRPRPGRYPNNNRFVGGGFLGPFLLGGLTGGLVAPIFYGGYNRPNTVYYYPTPYQGYYPYRPYY